MQTNCKALAKLVLNKKLQTVRLLVTFDNVSGRVTVLNAAFNSGDLCKAKDTDNLQFYVDRAVAKAKAALRTDNIVFVN